MSQKHFKSLRTPLLIMFLLQASEAFAGSERMSPIRFQTKSMPFPFTDRQNSCSCTPRDIYRRTPALGGGGGDAFDDAGCLAYNEVLQTVTLRGGDRVDGISFQTNRNTYTHGGSGSLEQSISLVAGEQILRADVCRGTKTTSGFFGVTGRVSIFFIRFVTTNLQMVEMGSGTQECRSFSSSSDEALIGTFGRAGSEIDQIGFIWRAKLCQQ